MPPPLLLTHKGLALFVDLLCQPLTLYKGFGLCVDAVLPLPLSTLNAIKGAWSICGHSATSPFVNSEHMLSLPLSTLNTT